MEIKIGDFMNKYFFLKAKYCVTAQPKVWFCLGFDVYPEVTTGQEVVRLMKKSENVIHVNLICNNLSNH